MTKIAETIRELRLERGITQQDLAKAIGVAKSVVYYWENGVNEPKASYIFALANFFDVSIDYLLGNMKNWNDGTVADTPPPASLILADDERELLKRYRTLSAKDKERIKTAIDIYADVTEEEKARKKGGA